MTFVSANKLIVKIPKDVHALKMGLYAPINVDVVNYAKIIKHIEDNFKFNLKNVF